MSGFVWWQSARFESSRLEPVQWTTFRLGSGCSKAVVCISGHGKILFEEGLLPEDSSGCDLVPILREFGSPDSAVVVRTAVLTNTRQIEPPRSGIEW